MKKLFALIGLLGLVAGMGGALKAQETVDHVEFVGDFQRLCEEQPISFKFSATPGEKFIIRGPDGHTDTIDVKTLDELEATYIFSKEYTDLNPSFSFDFIALSSTGHIRNFHIDSNNRYTSLIFFDCPLLDTAHIVHNDLKNLDFRNCPALTFVDCSYNKLIYSFFRQDSNWYPNLTYLDCSHNDIESLIATDCITLQTLDCSYNPNLWTLRTDDCKDLKSLNCSNTLLTSLDLTELPALQTLNCSNTQLTHLYLSKLPALQTLICRNTQLIVLSLSELPFLKTLDCSNNPQLENLSIQCPNLDSIHMNDNTRLLLLDIYDSRLTGIDLFDNTALTHIALRNNTMLETLDLSNLPVLEQLTCTNSPELKSLHCSNTLLISLELSELPTLQTLNCSNTQLPSFDLSELPALQTLNCSNTNITHLSLSNLPALQTLNCNNTQLSSLDLSELPALQTLNCSNNLQLTDLTINNTYLTSLDISNDTALESLSCHHNQLDKIDLSSNKNLNTLYCDHNQLSFIDISPCKNLQTLHCNNNRFTFLDIPDDLILNDLSCDSNHIPLSILAALCKQSDYCAPSQQFITAILQVGTALNLQGEMYIDNRQTDLTLLDTNGNVIDNMYDILADHSDGLLYFKNAGSYRLQLHNQFIDQNYSATQLIVYYDLTVVDSVVRPQFSIPSGAVLPDAELILSTPTSEARIYYTTDSSEPSENTLLYQAPIHITEAVTIKAIAIQDTFKSHVATASYTIDTVARPTFSIPSGKVKRGTTVSLNTTTPNARIIYTTDGIAPDNNALEYAAPIRINEAMTIKAVAIYTNIQSQVATATYTIDPVANEHDSRASKLRVYAKDRTIYLSEAVGEVEVFTMDGHCVYRGYDTAIPIKRSCLYIVSAAGKRWKVAVR